MLASHGDRWAELVLVTESLPRIVAVCVGVDYINFDIEPPSITFLDPVTREPSLPFAPPAQVDALGEVRNLLINHPKLGRPFWCLAGNLEYHEHPQHDGDLWLAEPRATHLGDLSVIADRLWQQCVRHRVLQHQFNIELKSVVNVDGWRQEAAEGSAQPPPPEDS